MNDVPPNTPKKHSISSFIDNDNDQHISLDIDNIDILKQLKTEADILAAAFKLNEADYMLQHRAIGLWILAFTGCTSILAGIESSNYALGPYGAYIMCGLNAIILGLVSIDRLLKPQQKQHDCNKMVIEFTEIANSIKMFIVSDKTRKEIEVFLKQTNFMLQAWKGLSPNIADGYIIKAKQSIIARPQRTSSGISTGGADG